MSPDFSMPTPDPVMPAQSNFPSSLLMAGILIELLFAKGIWFDV